MKDALLDRENCNLILVDWSKGAKFPYGQAAGNTRLVGAQIAVLIRFLISRNNGSPPLADQFYIVGFSLGAHTAGYAGSNMRAHGMVLGRITGTWFIYFIIHTRTEIVNTPLCLLFWFVHNNRIGSC